MLEVGCGSGAHAAWFAPRLPGLTWQPTEANPAALAVIAQWAASVKADNLCPPLLLDAASADWPVQSADAVVSINMVHYSPWESALGLMAGAGRVLSPGGVLYLYGPFRINGAQTAPSNARFEEWLKSIDPRFGVRDIGALSEAAAPHGLVFRERIAMPANNFSLVFDRR